MKLDVPYFEICNVPLDVVNSILSTIEEKDWYENDYRAADGARSNMQFCNSIPIQHTPLCLDGITDSDCAIKSIRKEPLYEKFYPVIKPVFDTLSKYYVFNQFACFLSRLQPSGVIGMHIDEGNFLTSCHRIHLPLQTDEEILYLIEEEAYHWKKGTLYEFDNTLMHGVVNNSNIYRIHLVINLYNI